GPADELRGERQPVVVEARGHGGGGLAGVVPGRRVADIRAAAVERRERALPAPPVRARRRLRGDGRQQHVVVGEERAEAGGDLGLARETARERSPREASAEAGERARAA